ncbi:hypothetical protein NU688_33120 [Variovorax sp. ZS18.2.2]|uniref:hypothetical protein n=1 Tax=Variovorax sp. ZS18.2.2 TaxID=2971255 RepID=UPI002150D0D3|nr:hypothetical protein [Variovorax sp. ZS18.2.2]MCR6481040.1 hypothetical protein [Variovorax sp. ZS18.2.2]
MTSNFQLLDAVPSYTRDLASTDQIKWSGDFEVPAVGDVVVMRINRIGRAQVVGYATESGYLGVLTVPFNPPDWWVRQNGPASRDNAALAFGAEILPAEHAG